MVKQRETAQRSPQRDYAGFRFRTPENRFDLGDTSIPPEMDTMWAAKTVGGKESENLIARYENGWTAVPKRMVPQFVGKKDADSDPDGEVVRGGQILLMRPRELTDLARLSDKERANEMVSAQLQRVGAISKKQVGQKYTRSSREVVSTAGVDGDADGDVIE